jgi:NAD(P)-dependent dehydrogenase (short-subunit alcohol dehydrogenase family)
VTEVPLPDPRPITELHCLFVGGTSGVGLASAIKLAEAGAPAVALIGRDAARGEAARAKVAAAAPQCRVAFFSADMNDARAAESVVSTAHGWLSRIDLLLCTTHAGTIPVLLHKMPPEDIQPMILKHLLGGIYACRFVLPVMQAQRGGSIVTISSDAAKIATPGEAVMGGLMAAIVMFSKTLAMEAKRHGIRVNVLTPSLITNTPSNEKVMADEFGRRLFAAAGKMASLGLTSPEDLADTVLFLASPASAKLTGQAISVNGGMSAG